MRALRPAPPAASGHPSASAFSRRWALSGAASATLAIAARPLPARAAPRYDATVLKDARGSHASLERALAAAAAAGGRPFRILLGTGVWTEKPTIATPNLTIEGASRSGTILSFAAAAGHARPGGGQWGTGGSATLTVSARDTILRRLTIRNAFDYIADTRSQASGGAQAVALALGAGADRTLAEEIDVLGYQDTLYVREGRAAFERCRIAGGVDFVFGGAAALFRGCEIVSRHVPGAAIQGFIAAPSTPAAQPHGLVFAGCRLVREAGVPDRSVYLGRPWRAGGNPALLGSAVFLRCWMDAHVRREGWAAMGFRDAAGRRLMLQAGDARVFEHGSTGPGAGRAGPERRMLDAASAEEFAPARVLAGWRT